MFFSHNKIEPCGTHRELLENLIHEKLMTQNEIDMHRKKKSFDENFEPGRGRNKLRLLITFDRLKFNR